MRANLVSAKIAFLPTPEETYLDAKKSILLSSILSCTENQVLLFLHESMKKDQNLGRLFENIKPDSNSKYTLEVGAELPDLLPNLNGRDDYWVDVNNDDTEPNMLSISNQMMRIDYLVDDIHKIAILPRCSFCDLEREDSPIKIDANTPMKLLRTMVSSRFTIDGTDAEDALETHINSVINKFLGSVNIFLQANQMLSSGDEYPALPSGYDQTSLDYLYIAIFGESIHRNAFSRLALNLGKVTLRPNSVDGLKADRLIAYLNGTDLIDNVHIMMNSAKNALDGGVLKLALLQMVIAAEMAISRYINLQLKAKGVSSRNLTKYKREMSYAVKLNIHLIALAQAHLKPDKDMMEKLNRARVCRNKLMHEGEMQVNRDELYELYSSTKCFIEYISHLENEE